ncbi:MAG: heavy metal sensor histidine kinase [Gammaproteobacteria bacterium]|nr:heavy metal sensor histidine kinase [Gammaproteobacteria bacterium]
MRRPLSLAARLTLLFGVASAIVFPIFGWVIVQSTEGHFEAEDLDELEVIADAVRAVLIGGGGANPLGNLEQRFDDILVGHHEASLSVATQDGRAIYASETPDLSRVTRTAGARANQSDIQQWADEDHSYRGLIQSVRDETKTDAVFTVIVAVPIDHHLRFLEHFRRSLLLTVTGSIAFMGFMGWLAVRWGHAPLHDMVAHIRRISTNELSTRLEPDAVPGEISELAIAFNELLQRLDEAFHRLSDFNADLAHELRTPIANLTTQTQVALSRARAIEEYRELLYSNLEEYERVAQMVTDMLFLAQADQRQQRLSVTDVDLVTEIRALFDFFDGWADESGVTLALAGTASVSANQLMLQRALGNLIANAIRHARKGTTVRVALHTSHDGKTRIDIENMGAAIPPEHIPKLFNRFYRIDPSRRRGDDGVGLGLAIVASIVKLHGGTIDVESDEQSTRFTVTLATPVGP